MKKKNIPLSIPCLKGNEVKYVTAAIESGWVSTGGAYVNDFENNIAEYVHTAGAVSCQNGTSGIHIALLAAGVTREHMVIVPALTFIAAVNPVSYIGAEPIFMDCDDSLCMDSVKLRKFCEEECILKGDKLFYKKNGCQIKAVVVVHVFGNMADMEQIADIAGHYHLKLIEDATEALGTYYTKGRYKNKFAGTIGDLGVYSFNGNKIITTGGGGMIVSDEEKYLKRARHLTTQAKSDELYYIHDEIGYNYRLTNLQAALGLAQLEQLEDFIRAKEQNYTVYKNMLEAVKGLTLMPFRENIRSNHWFYAIYCDKPYPMDRDRIIEKLSEAGIQSRPIWGLINEQIPYRDKITYMLSKSVMYWKNVINIPCSSGLEKEDISYICEILSKV